MSAGPVVAASTVRSVLEWTPVALALVGVVLAGSLARWLRDRWAEREPSERRALSFELDERLDAALGPGTGSHLETAPAVRRIERVRSDDSSDDSSEDANPRFAPVVRVELGTTDAPGTDLVVEYVAAVLETIHPVFGERDERVHRYDVEFTFGPDGLLVAGECRRVSVPPELADRLLEESRYGALELRRELERGDTDPESVATLWGVCRS